MCIGSSGIRTSVGVEITKETNPLAAPAIQILQKLEGFRGESPKSSRELL